MSRLSEAFVLYDSHVIILAVFFFYIYICSNSLPFLLPCLHASVRKRRFKLLMPLCLTYSRCVVYTV